MRERERERERSCQCTCMWHSNEYSALITSNYFQCILKSKLKVLIAIVNLICRVTTTELCSLCCSSNGICGYFIYDEAHVCCVSFLNVEYKHIHRLHLNYLCCSARLGFR